MDVYSSTDRGNQGSHGLITRCTTCVCSKVEVKLEGDGPWQLPDGSEDFDLVLTPGHTEAHVVAIYKPEKVHQTCKPLSCLSSSKLGLP